MAIRSGNRVLWWYAAAYLVLLALDQGTKYVARTSLGVHQSVAAIPGVWFTYVKNTGAIWGSFQDSNGLFIILTAAALAAMIYFRKEFGTVIEKSSLVMILAGLSGNLIDRMLLGFVVDFIDLRWWPIFNIADAAIVMGVLLYILEQARKKRSSAQSQR